MFKDSSYYLLILVVLLIISCQKSADLIVHNASIYTMDDRMEKASAFVINKGKFIDVGGDEILKK